MEIYGDTLSRDDVPRTFEEKSWGKIWVILTAQAHIKMVKMETAYAGGKLAVGHEGSNSLKGICVQRGRCLQQWEAWQEIGKVGAWWGLEE